MVISNSVDSMIKENALDIVNEKTEVLMKNLLWQRWQETTLVKCSKSGPSCMICALFCKPRQQPLFGPYMLLRGRIGCRLL